MRSLFKKIKQNGKRIEAIEVHITNIQQNPYYKIFNREEERQEGFKVCAESLKEALNERQMILENIAIETQKQLNYVSQMQRTNTLLKTA